MAKKYNERAGREEMKEVIRKMYKLTIDDSTKVLEMYETALESLLSQGKRVILPGHGSYRVDELAARVMHLGPNAPYNTPETVTIRFKPGRTLQQNVKKALGYGDDGDESEEDDG